MAELSIRYARELNRTCVFHVRDEYQVLLKEYGFSSTRVGFWQDLDSKIDTFSLGGPKRRRLRHAYQRYAHLEGSVTEEVVNSGHDRFSKEFPRIIEAWVTQKRSRAGFMQDCAKRIASGEIGRHHRIFSTSSSGKLDNLIVVTLSSSSKTALLDLEFYVEDAPYGHLEFAIINAISRLRGIGVENFSLGLTFGCGLLAPEEEDQQLCATLMRMKKHGLDGDGNLQFKNKFGTNNVGFWICTSDTSTPRLGISVAKLIADPQISLKKDARTFMVDVEQFYNDLCKRCVNRVVDGGFFDNFATMTDAEIREFLTDLYVIAREYPKLLGLLIWKSPNTRAMFTLADNLIDELGGSEKIKEGDSSLMPTRLLQTFGVKVGIASEDFETMTGSSHANELLKFIEKSYISSPFAKSIACIAIGIEIIFPELASRFFTGLVNRFPETDLIHFRNHMAVDAAHDRNLRSLIYPIIEHDVAARALFEEGAMECISKECEFLAGVGVNIRRNSND